MDYQSQTQLVVESGLLDSNFLLLFGALLTIGAVGEHKKFPELPRGRHTTFELLVVVGIAGELLADGRIFVFSRHLQSISDGEFAILNKEAGKATERAAITGQFANEANLELARMKIPRTIENAESLVRQLKQFAGTDYEFSSQFEEESLRLLNSIDGTLRLAGWSKRTSNGTRVGAGSGVVISVGNDAPQRVLDAAIALQRGLYSSLSPKAGDGEVLIRRFPGNDQALHLLIGKKP